MTAFSSGLKVLMMSAQGTEEGERTEKRNTKCTRVKECRDKRASRGQNHKRRHQRGHKSSPVDLGVESRFKSFKAFQNNISIIGAECKGEINFIPKKV